MKDNKKATPQQSGVALNLFKLFLTHEGFLSLNLSIACNCNLNANLRWTRNN
jgi:hypothetical protein